MIITQSNYLLVVLSTILLPSTSTSGPRSPPFLPTISNKRQKTKAKGVAQRPKNVSMACSICASTCAGERSAQNPPPAANAAPWRRRGAVALPRISGLDTSFVNIPNSRYPPVGNGGLGDHECNFHDIESILDEALRSSCEENGGDMDDPNRREIIVNGADIQEASRRIDALLVATMNVLEGKANGGEEKGHQNLYCQSCLDR